MAVNNIDEWGMRILCWIGQLGGSANKKGRPHVAEAAVQVLRKYPELIWWLVAREGPESRKWVEIGKAAGLDKKIVFFSQRNNVPVLMKRAYLHIVG